MVPPNKRDEEPENAREDGRWTFGDVEGKFQVQTQTMRVQLSTMIRKKCCAQRNN